MEMVELTNVTVVRVPEEDDAKSGLLAYRAFATGPNGRFFVTVKYSPRMIADWTLDALARSDLQYMYEYMASRERT